MPRPAGQKNSFLAAATIVLADSEEPLGADEITARALAQGLLQTSGLAPSATMAARLYQEINRLGGQSRFVKVAAGRFALRSSLSVPIKTEGDVSPRSPGADTSSVVPIASSDIERLARELLTAQTDSRNPTRFEQAVCDAFDLLGFEATRLGGSGETDVYLVALAGVELYRVVVDAKSTANARVTDGQIDWNSLRDHRAQRDAQHVLVVAPGFAGGNLLKRASEYQVALLEAKGLADIIRRHVETPFSLLELRPLFEGPGHVTQALEDLRRLHEATARQWVLLPEIVRAYADLGDVRPDVSGIYLYLRGRQGTRTLWRETVEHAIGVLASPILGILRPHNGGGYALTMRPETALRRLGAMTLAVVGTEDAKLTVIPATVTPEPPSLAPSVPPSNSADRLESRFATVRERVVARLTALGYREVGRRPPHIVVLKRQDSTVAVSFRASRFYAEQRKWWWTFHDRVEGKARQEVDSVVLVGMMVGEKDGEVIMDRVTWIDWDLAKSRVAHTIAWTKDRKVQVEVSQTGRGRWGDRMIPIDNAPDPLQTGSGGPEID